MKKRAVVSDVPASNSNGTNGGTNTGEPSLETITQTEIEIKQFLDDLPQAYQLDLDADPFDPTYSSSSSSLSAPPAGSIPPAYLIVQRCELVIIAHQLILKLFLPFLRRPGIKSSDNSMIASIDSAHSIIKAASIIKGVWQKQSAGGDSTGINPRSDTVSSSHGIFYPFSRQLFDAAVVAAHIVIRAPQSIVSSVAMDDLRLALGILRDPSLITGRGRSSQRGGVEGAPSEAVTIVEMLLKKAEMARRNYVPVAAGTKRKHDEVDPNLSKGFWLPYVGGGVATDTKSPVVTNGHNQTSPKTKSVDKSENRTTASSVRSGSDKEHMKYPPSVRSKASFSSINEAKSVSSSMHHRRDSSHSSSLSIAPPPPPTMPLLPPDPEIFVRPSTANGLPSSAGPTPISRADYVHATTYNIEEQRRVNSHASPTASRFPSHPPALDMHNFGHPYPPRSSSSTQPPPYNSAGYNPEHGRSADATSYYVPFQPPLPSNLSGIDDHSQTHSHPSSHDSVLSSQHMMMDLIPTQPTAHTGDASRRPKEDDQHHNNQPADSHFAPEGWTTNPAISRFSHSPWDSGYTY